MKKYKGFALGLVMGLALAVSSLAFAQEAKNTADKTSCCACCTMQHGKGHDSSKHEGKEGCCCCSSESCDIHMKDKQTEKKG